MKKMKQMMAVILAGVLIAGSLQISAGAAETVPLDPEPVAETPFDEEGLVEMQSDEVGLVESQSVEELYADSQSDETDIAEAQAAEDDFAEVQTDENNYPEETESWKILRSDHRCQRVYEGCKNRRIKISDHGSQTRPS